MYLFKKIVLREQPGRIRTCATGHWTTACAAYLSLDSSKNLMILNETTAELCGIILGDGNLHKTYNRITISGSSDDLFYFRNHVIPLFRNCFRVVNPRIVRMKGKPAYNLEIENREIFQFFITVFDLKRGPKDNARVPSVVSSSSALIPHFLRGLFDTDGCLKFSKQARSYSYYPRIKIALASSPLAHQLGFLFAEAGFTACKNVRPNHGYKTTRDLVAYEISGQKALERWMHVVRPANPVQTAKYVYWKKFGRHVPNMSFSERVLRIGLGGFEPPSQESESRILDRYTTGLYTQKNA